MSDKEPQQWMRDAAEKISGLVLGKLKVEGFNRRVQFMFQNDVAEIIAAHCPEKELGHGTEPAESFRVANTLRPDHLWRCGMCAKRILTFCDFHINERPICAECNSEMAAELEHKCPTCGSTQQSVYCWPCGINATPGDSWHSSVATQKEKP